MIGHLRLKTYVQVKKNRDKFTNRKKMESVKINNVNSMQKLFYQFSANTYFDIYGMNKMKSDSKDRAKNKKLLFIFFILLFLSFIGASFFHSNLPFLFVTILFLMRMLSINGINGTLTQLVECIILNSVISPARNFQPRVISSKISNSPG